MTLNSLTRPLTFSAGVPAIDHHSHAAYIRPGESIDGVDAFERENALGHVEANIPHSAYRSYLQAQLHNDAAAVAALSDEFGIEQLIENSVRFQSTTVHASAVREGALALYGPLAPAQTNRISKQRRIDDFAGLYDEALVLSGTESVLTDLPRIDSVTWPHERYKPIGRIDPYLYPFGHPPYDERGGDTPKFMRVFDSVLKDELDVADLSEPPASLDEYLDFVLGALERRRSIGFVGLKIASAYVRDLRFEPVDLQTAREAYRALSAEREGVLINRQAHRHLADFLVYEIAAQAIILGFPMQIHTGMGHGEPGLKLTNASPLNLERFIDSPRINRLKIVLIHGGYPYSSLLAALSQSHGNVFLDYSWMPYLHDHALRRMLQEWLEVLPANKVMFGTDTASPELHVAATRRARVVLDRTLEAGRESGLWSARQAGWLAERVLHQNLRDVYGFDA